MTTKDLIELLKKLDPTEECDIRTVDEHGEKLLKEKDFARVYNEQGHPCSIMIYWDNDA